MAQLTHNLIARRFIMKKGMEPSERARSAAQSNLGGYQGIVEKDCDSCIHSEAYGTDYCPESRRACLHHCNHIVSHDSCDWCGFKEPEDE